MKTLYFLIIFIYINSYATTNIDSLKHILNTVKDDTICVETLNKLSQFYKKNNPQLSLQYALKAEKVAKKCNYNNGIATALYTIGGIYSNKNNNELAINSYNNCVNIYIKNKNKIGLSNTYNSIGNIFIKQKKYNKALDYYNKSLEINKILNNSNRIANSYLNIGIAYNYKNEYDKALINFYKSLRLNESVNNKYGIANAHLNIGIIYFNIESYKQAMSNLEQSLNIFKETNNKNGTAETLLYLGKIYTKQEMYKKAVDALSHSININRKLKKTTNIADAFLKIGDINIIIGNYHKAYENYMKSLKLYISENNNIGIVNVRLALAKYYFNLNNLVKAENQLKDITSLSKKYKMLKQELEISQIFTKIYLKQRKFEDASAMLLKYITISNSLNNIKKDKEKHQLQIKYELDKQTYLNELNNIKKDANNRLHIQKLKTIQFIIIIFLILSVIIAFVLFKKSKEIKSKNRTLELQQKQIAEQLEELKFRKQALKKANYTKAKFLSIMANDLRYSFNRINGFISSITEPNKAINTKMLHKYLYLIKEAGNNTMSMLDNVLEWAKSTNDSFTAHKQNIQLNNLLKGNILLIKQQAQQKNIKIIESLSNNPTVNIDVNMINTVIRNLLSNAIKFTNDNGKIWVKTIIKDNDIKIVIQDTGIGLSDNQLDNIFNIKYKNTNKPPSTKLGLILCREFLSYHHQELKVDSKIDFGTTFWFYLPVVTL